MGLPDGIDIISAQHDLPRDIITFLITVPKGVLDVDQIGLNAYVDINGGVILYGFRGPIA